MIIQIYHFYKFQPCFIFVQLGIDILGYHVLISVKTLIFSFLWLNPKKKCLFFLCKNGFYFYCFCEFFLF